MRGEMFLVAMMLVVSICSFVFAAAVTAERIWGIARGKKKAYKGRGSRGQYGFSSAKI